MELKPEDYEGSGRVVWVPAPVVANYRIEATYIDDSMYGKICSQRHAL